MLNENTLLQEDSVVSDVIGKSLNNGEKAEKLKRALAALTMTENTWKETSVKIDNKWVHDTNIYPRAVLERFIKALPNVCDRVLIDDINMGHFVNVLSGFSTEKRTFLLMYASEKVSFDLVERIVSSEYAMPEKFSQSNIMEYMEFLEQWGLKDEFQQLSNSSDQALN